MSVWTHVAGLIRIDSLPMAGLPYLYTEALEMAFLMGVPGGSEGPIKLAVHRIVHPREVGNIENDDSLEDIISSIRYQLRKKIKPGKGQRERQLKGLEGRNISLGDC